MRLRPARFLASLVVTGLLLPAAASPPPPPLSQSTPAESLRTEAIVERLMAANRQRDELLAGWQVRRRYHLTNEIYEKEVERIVDVTFRAPHELSFEMVREQGSGFVAKRVFDRMMEGEQEALEPENKRRSAMTPQNYDFRLLGQETLEGRPAYQLEVTPRREDTFLFQGTIWVDTEDFAVVRAQGKPAKRPSFWTRDIDFLRTFKKVGPFWLPARTESVTEVLLFGTTWTTIENGDYKVRLNSSAGGRP
ncbi:hypothetical protein MYX77_01835 [Acidobacteriia bacterium AH_259_A11_L15]|nr:hypothetical protein [Acidobacteriia bacterium AH_259_A11_L15]